MEPKELIEELLSSGLTQSQLAESVPCSQSLIAALLGGSRGKQTSYLIVDGLKKLHAERCSKPAGVI